MLKFTDFLKEQYLIEEEEGKLKHIHHAEDRPLLHGHSGFEHAHGALMAAHEHMKAGSKSNKVTMKYDGSPSVVFGHHPDNGKFFVATKSAFNKNPKINHSHEDIDRNHGHAPGLASKLHAAFDHLKKVAPKKGVYQGDIMHTKEDLKEEKVSFTPNTITYTAHGDQAKKIKKSKIGVVVHTKYDEKGRATPHVDHENFGQHEDVHHHGAEHDTSKIDYPEHKQAEFHKHMEAAKAIHDTHGPKMYKATERHQGEGGHLGTYINSTVRNDTVPSTEGFKKHLEAHYEKKAQGVKTEKSQAAKRAEGAEHVAHVEANKEHYSNLFAMHHHLQQAKNTLVHSLESHTGHYQHHIDGKETKPEGFVVHHEHEGKSEPTKLVNRAEFAKANLTKIKNWKK